MQKYSKLGYLVSKLLSYSYVNLNALNIQFLKSILCPQSQQYTLRIYTRWLFGSHFTMSVTSKIIYKGRKENVLTLVVFRFRALDQKSSFEQNGLGRRLG